MKHPRCDHAQPNSCDRAMRVTRSCLLGQPSAARVGRCSRRLRIYHATLMRTRSMFWARMRITTSMRPIRRRAPTSATLTTHQPMRICSMMCARCSRREKLIPSDSFARTFVVHLTGQTSASWPGQLMSLSRSYRFGDSVPKRSNSSLLVQSLKGKNCCLTMERHTGRGSRSLCRTEFVFPFRCTVSQRARLHSRCDSIANISMGVIVNL